MKESKQQLLPFKNIVIRVSQVMASVGAVMYVSQMFVTVIDVAGRFFFVKPLRGAFEIIGILLVVGGSWGLAYAQVLNMNIRMSILSDRFPQKVRSWLWILTYSISAVISGMIAWQAFVKVIDYLGVEYNVAKTETLGIHLWPFVLAMAIGFALVCSILVWEIIKVIRELCRR
jgi:TRAP-type C4-dicarboxylate transport system permease small subunit